jgi:carbon storage regulator
LYWEAAHMLVLGVNEGDYVMIGDEIKIRVMKTGAQFRLAIDAPRELLVLRKSLYESENPPEEAYPKSQYAARRNRAKP